MSDFLDDMLEMLGPPVAIGGGVLSLIVGGLWIIIQLSLPGELARIEQLRSDASQVSPQEAEDVFGQVTEVNQHIAACRRYNQIPVLCLMVPNVWDHVEPIRMKR